MICINPALGTCKQIVRIKRRWQRRTWAVQTVRSLALMHRPPHAAINCGW